MPEPITPAYFVDHSGHIVQAVQLSPDNGADVWEWADSKPFYEYLDGELTVTGLNILHPRGRIKAEFGDWVVRQSDGTFRPFKPDQFEARHSQVGQAFTATATNSPSGVDQ